MLAQLVLSDERARNIKGILQTFSVSERDVEKGIAKIGPLGLVLAAKRWMDGIGRRDYQYIGIRQTRNEDT